MNAVLKDICKVAKYLIFIVLIGTNVYAMEGQSAALPADVISILDEHSMELQGQYLTTCTYPWLPGWYVKRGVERVENALTLKKIIRENNLYYLSVADKYVYHIPGKPDHVNDDNYLVISKEVQGTLGSHILLNKQQVEQLYQLIEIAGYYDLHCQNYVVPDKGQVVIIDTDLIAMPPRWKHVILKMDYFFCGQRFNHFLRFNNDSLWQMASCAHYLLETPEGKQYEHFFAYNLPACQFLLKKMEEREQLRKTRLKLFTGFTVLGCVGAIALFIAQKKKISIFQI